MRSTLAAGKADAGRAGDPTVAAKGSENQAKAFRSGLALDAKANLLYSLDIDAGTIVAIDLAASSRSGPQRSAVGHMTWRSRATVRGYTCRTGPGASCWRIDPDDCMVAKIGVGEHPNQIAGSPKDDRLFVACAISNHVAVIDTAAAS